MNFSLNKSTLLTIICIFMCVPFYGLKAITLPWYHTHFHAIKGAQYRENTLLIHCAQLIRYATNLIYYRATYKKNDLYLVLSGIQAQLKTFEKYLLELEQEALLDIKKKYEITDDIWNKYMTDIQRVKKSHRIAMSQSDPKAIHDPAVPADIKDMLIVQLKENNINPNSINIVMATQEEIKNEPRTLALAKQILSVHDNSEYPIILEKYNPATITIFPCLLQAPLHQKMGTCAHEVQHISAQHSLSLLVLYEYLEKYYSVATAEFHKTPEFHQLAEIQEAQADTFATLSAPRTAHYMKMKRQRNYYPDYLYEEHYYHLSTIDMLWKLHNKLEDLYFKA